jgi:hypothetical protein
MQDKTLKMHILWQWETKKEFCHSFFNNILHFCTFSENDAQAFLDLDTNLMKNSQMVPFLYSYLIFVLSKKGH